MTAPLSPEQIERALELQALGRTRSQIAGELKCDRKTVGRWLRRHNTRAWARLEKEAASEKFRQVEQLRLLAGEMIAAWFASKKSAVSVKRTSGGDGGPRTEKTVKGQCGNPAFSAEARACLADIRRLLRIDKDDDPDDSAAAAALVTLSQAFDAAVSALPEGVQELAREQVSKALLEMGRRDRTDA